MITTIVNGNCRIEKSILAVNLAAWCIRRQRKVLMVNAASHKHVLLWHLRRGNARLPLPIRVHTVLDASLYKELEQMPTHCREVVIDVDDVGASETRTALTTAHTAVVPICTQPRDERAEAQVLALVERTQLFNPRLRVILVVIKPEGTEASEAVASAHALASRMRSATVSPVIIHDTAQTRAAFQRGETVFEAKIDLFQAIEEMEALGRAVFGIENNERTMAAELKAAFAKLKAWHRNLQPDSRNQGRVS